MFADKQMTQQAGDDSSFISNQNSIVFFLLNKYMI